MIGKELMAQMNTTRRDRPPAQRSEGPTPEKLCADGSEHGHQAAFFNWRDRFVIENRGRVESEFPGLPFMHAIPNGGDRDKITAGQMAQEGVLAGVYDMHLPVARGGYFGLMIELKKPGREGDQNGGLSAKQIAYRTHLDEHGYAHAVAYSWTGIRDLVFSYYRLPKTERASPNG